MKSGVKSVVVLSVICVVIAVILAFANKVTAPIIAKNSAAAETKALTVVMPDAKGFEEVTLAENSTTTVQKVYKETSGLGYVVVLSTKSQYSQDNMGIIVAISTEGKITGITLNGYYESKDFGKDTYPQTYIGADSALNGIDTFAGVTYSSTAFKNAVSDAFTVLIANGFVTEGQKSDEQIVKDMIPTILPGCVQNTTGTAQVTETTVEGYDKAYVANNGCGYVLFSKTTSLVYVINAFGDYQCYDLEGNKQSGTKDVTVENYATKNLDANLTRVKRVFDDGAEITAIDSVPVFGCVTGAFKAVVNGETYYAFDCRNFGYKDVMEMIVVLDANGKVVKYKAVTDLIQEAEYYTKHELTDASAYVSKFVGLDEASYTDDVTAVTGATITSTAVASALRSAFEAFKVVAK